MLEVGSIVLAVLLALFANDWREARSESRRVDRALVSLQQEVTRNLEDVQRAHAHHGAVRADIEAFAQAHPDPSPEALDSLLTALYERPGGTTATARVVGAAWRTAEATGTLGAMDHAYVFALSDVYEAQAAYLATTQAMNSSILESLFQPVESEAFARGIYEVVNTLWWKEYHLIDLYEAALDELPPPPASGSDD